MDTVIALTDLRADLPGIVKKITRGFNRLIVTVFGKPKVVIMNLEELESLEETMDILSEPGALREIKAASRQARQRKGVRLEDLKL